MQPLQASMAKAQNHSEKSNFSDGVDQAAGEALIVARNRDLRA
jgi:hypothetical protein